MPIEHGNIARYQELFVNRTDAYAEQTRSGRYFVQREPVTERVIVNHLSGRHTIGLYALDQDNTTKWVVLDADSTDGLDHLRAASKSLQERRIDHVMETSRRGGHLWVLTERVSVKAARTLVTSVAPLAAEVEVFPKQEQLTRNHPMGSLVRAPLGVHQLTGKVYPLVDPVSLRPVSESQHGMLGYLGDVKRLTASQVAEHLATLLREQSSSPRPDVLRSIPEPASRPPTLVEQVKARIGDPYTFISRMVELSPTGRACCPFHPPDNHPSFSVNPRTGRWTCFHEYVPPTTEQQGHYLSGDAIDFYAKFKGISTRQALHELLRDES